MPKFRMVLATVLTITSPTAVAVSVGELHEHCKAALRVAQGASNNSMDLIESQRCLYYIEGVLDSMYSAYYAEKGQVNYCLPTKSDEIEVGTLFDIFMGFVDGNKRYQEIKDRPAADFFYVAAKNSPVCDLQ